MYDILEELNAIPGTQGSMLLGRDGFVIVSNVASGVEERTVSAMIASITSEVGQTVSVLRRGELQAVSLFTSGGNIFFLCREDVILAMLTESAVNTGLVRVRMKDGLERIAGILAGK